jgi:hypothetical protein
MSTDGEGNGGTFLLSPLAHKTTSKSHLKSQRKSSLAPRVVIEERPFIPDPSPLPSDTEEALETEAEDNDDISSIAPSGTTASNLGDESQTTEDDDDLYADSDEEDGDWEEPLSNKTPKAKRNVPVSTNPTPSPKPKTKASKSTPRVSKLAEDMDLLQIGRKSADDSVAILSKKSKMWCKPSMAPAEEEDGDEPYDLPVVKKKKRLVLEDFPFCLC